MRWIIGIVAVVVVAILGYQYFGGARDVDVAEQVQQGAEQAAEEVGKAAEATGEAVKETVEGATEGAQDTAEQAAESTQDTAEDVAAGAEQAAEEAQDTAEQATEEAQDAAEQAAAATEDAAGEATDQAREAAGAVQESLTEAQTAALTVGDVNIGEQLTDIVGNAQTSLQGITDAQSAEAAVPALNQINDQLTKLSTTVDQLPADAKKVLSDFLGGQVTELKGLAESVTNQEGVGEVLNPVLEPIMAKLESWAQQPA